MTPEDIRIRRVDLGMRPEDLATALGVSVRTIARWESGAQIPKKRDVIALDTVLSEQVRAKSAPRTPRKSNKR